MFGLQQREDVCPSSAFWFSSGPRRTRRSLPTLERVGLLYRVRQPKCLSFWKHPPGHTQNSRFPSPLSIPQPRTLSGTEPPRGSIIDLRRQRYTGADPRVQLQAAWLKSLPSEPSTRGVSAKSSLPGVFINEV